MDYRRLVKAGVILILGIFLGKPIVEAVDGAITVYQMSGQATTQQVAKPVE